MRRHSPQQQFIEACQIARDHDMFVVDKFTQGGAGAGYILYRRVHGRAVRLGRRRDVGEFRRFVEKCAEIKPGN